MISFALWVSCFGLYLFIFSQSHNGPGVKTNCYYSSLASQGYFCFLNLIFPLSVPGHLTHLPLHSSKESLTFAILHASPLCCHFTYGHSTLRLALFALQLTLFYLPLFQSSALHNVTKALGCNKEIWESPANAGISIWKSASPKVKGI